MSKWSTALVALLLASPVAAQPVLRATNEPDYLIEAGDIGVGLEVGDPFAATLKLYVTDDQALTAAVGVRATYIENGVIYGGPAVGPHVSLDWTIELVDFGPSSTVVTFSPYVGVGAQLGWYEDGCFHTSFGRIACSQGLDTALGVRAPIGFNAKFSPVTIEAYIQVVPVVGILPKPLYADIAGTTGARFFF